VATPRGDAQEPSPRVLAARRLARVGLWATGGLVVGTVGQVATGNPLWSALGAAAGAVIAVVLNRRGGSA